MNPLEVLSWAGTTAFAIVTLAVGIGIAIVVVRAFLAAKIGPEE